jgi:hypothetical protein
MKLNALLLAAFALAGCYADPTGPGAHPSVLAPPPSQSSAPAILFTNGCGFTAGFSLFVDDAAPEMFLIADSGAVEKRVLAGRHAVQYIAFDANAKPLAVRRDSLTVTGPTPYTMTCQP